jgi:hypothetical protein
MNAIRAIQRTTLLLFVALPGCQNSPDTQVVDVALKNTELCEYPAVGGDEEGARIFTQAAHFSVSEIRRNTATGFVATYVYQATSGFVGADQTEVEVLPGSDGASPPKRVTRIVFRFSIHD